MSGYDGLDPHDLDEAVDRAASPLRALDGASVFVTGATGFFGRWILALLARARPRLGVHLDVTALSRDPDAFARTWPDLASLDFVRWHRGDVTDFAFPQTRFSHVVHAATDTNVAADREPEQLVTAIAEGTRRALAFARARGARRFLYVSSGAVYGPQPPELPILAENYHGAPDPLDPRTAYAQGKRLAEHLCALAAARGEVEAVIARGFAFVGPGLALDGHFAIGNFIRDAIAGRTIVVTGDGTPVRSYLYAADLATWMVTLLVRGESGTAYNVGSDRAVDLAELARLVAAAVPSAGGVTVEGRHAAGSPRRRYVPSIARARSLALEAWTPLNEAVRRTAAFAGTMRN